MITASGSGLSGKRVLVTGGTGFIGGRLVERLVLEQQANVRVLVRNLARVPRIACLPIEIVPGDITEPDDLERAFGGCEVVFHCAYGSSGSREVRQTVTVEGTRNVLAAALRAGAGRVVHLSTVMVYGSMPEGELDESMPRHYSGHVYTDSKLDAEQIAFDYVQRHGLPVSVIQPTTIYGPFAPTWTVDVLEQLKTGRVILVDGGDGLRNVVYIDDVVSAVLLAATKREAIGEAFLVSDGQPITWQAFYRRFERMLGTSGTVSMSASEAEIYYATTQRRPRGILREVRRILSDEPSIRERLLRTPEITALRRAGRFLVPADVRRSLRRRMRDARQRGRKQVALEPEKPIHALSPVSIRFCTAKTVVRIDKARRMLGYQPAFDFVSGTELTEQWARWANLLDG